ncbi:hypothetical protein AZF37_05070 [endosymbiont 'TC1' of Trimyema compressum]|nr:hypothetical protein AZF37_05070 [endosymbiont 'TC1' of Trimyema compressum]
MPKKGLEKYNSFQNLRNKNWQYHLYQRDEKTGYNCLSFINEKNCLLGFLVQMKLGLIGWTIIFV